MLEDVLCLPVKNVAGALHTSLQLLAEQDVNIDYIYGFGMEESQGGVAVIKCDNILLAKRTLTERFDG